MVWNIGAWDNPSVMQISNLVSVENNGIGTTSTDGLALTNSTAATLGAQQISPRFRMTGRGYKTNAPAGSQTVDWIGEVIPVRGAAAPQARLDWKYQIGGAGFTTALSFLDGSVGFSTLTPRAQVELTGTLLMNGSGGLIRQADTARGLLQAYDTTNLAYRAQQFDAGTFLWLLSNVPVAVLDSASNFGLGTGAFGTGLSRGIGIALGTPPSTIPADVFQMWAADRAGVAGQVSLHWMSEGGNSGVLGDRVSVGTILPDRLFHVEIADTSTAAVSYIQRLSHVVSTPATGSADGFGVGLEFELETSTDGTNQIAGTVESVWATAAVSARKGRLNLYAYDTAARLGITVEASGTAPMLGFYGVAAAARPTAYTQTYALADKTHAAFTSADLATTAATQTTPWGFATAAQANDIATQFNALRTDVADLKQLVNSLIDDGQALGLLQ